MYVALYKKANEAQGTIDYYEGRLTGNGLIELFADEAEAGRRERRTRSAKIDVSYTISEGETMMRGNKIRKFRDILDRYRAKVTPGEHHEIRRKHLEEGLRVRDLVELYPQHARETIRRVLGGGRGYVGVAGMGWVETTDNR